MISTGSRLSLLSVLLAASGTLMQGQKFRHIENTRPEPEVSPVNLLSAEEEKAIADSLRLDSLISHLTDPPAVPSRFPVVGATGASVSKVFAGYRYIQPKPGFSRAPMDIDSENILRLLRTSEVLPDSVQQGEVESEEIPEIVVQDGATETGDISSNYLETLTPYYSWIKEENDLWRSKLDFAYVEMIRRPFDIDYAYWNLPVPPEMPPDDPYVGVMSMKPLFVNTAFTPPEEPEPEKRHWLHVLNAGLQFSQAYLSRNWYQGGNNYLALLANFLWDVKLNEAFHPKLMFESTLSYKLGLNSTEDNQYHKYSISEDLFQYNIKAGYKAAHHWYYSLTGQFKTQMLRNYASDSDTRLASFLTPGNLNFGLGMTYTMQNKAKTIQFNASLSPLSYNLRTAIDPAIDHLQFGIPQDAKTHSEFGSTAEITFNWQMGEMVNYKTRLFLFTDYKESNADWQNTFEFRFNRFFSTQIYINVRYDSTADINLAPGWKRWMLKEILSVGLSYTFSSKP